MILLDTSLSRVERKCALAHELVHVQRGGGSCDPYREKEERIVDRIVAERLVPLGELMAFCHAREVVEPWEVAEHFDVTDDVARLALERLQAPEEWAA